MPAAWIQGQHACCMNSRTTDWIIWCLVHEFKDRLKNLIPAVSIYRQLTEQLFLLQESTRNCLEYLISHCLNLLATAQRTSCLLHVKSRLINTQMGRTNVESYICDRDWKFEDTNNLEARPVRFCMHNAAIMDKAVGNAVSQQWSDYNFMYVCSLTH